ncbi:hypothetical protein QJS10_CPB20g00756 [Acorus calamus]|uniref:Uncharacterized protein n=1 Tax=Acorus calamus TaxID=4465 RepID=A0AAV9C9N7_ACOCL|nr:hypothetical protein QJS10_CPB20g00756 [Acorus calamus]
MGHAIKALINTNDVEEVSIIDNATAAAATIVLHHRRFDHGDAVVMLHCTSSTEVVSEFKALDKGR